MPLLLRCVGHEKCRPQLPESGIILAPTELREGQVSMASLNLFRRRSAPGPASCISAIQDEMRHLLRMPNRIGNSHRTTLGNPQNGKAVQADSVYDGLHILNQRLERKVFDSPFPRSSYRTRRWSRPNSSNR